MHEELGRARAADQGQVERLLTGEQRSAATPRVTRRERRSRPRRPRRAPPTHRPRDRRGPLDRRSPTRPATARPRRAPAPAGRRAARAARASARHDRARGRRAHATGRAFSEGDLEERGLLLDREARKRRGVVPGPRADPDAYRDYQRLAPLADLSADAYRALPPGEQRRARLTIDRELDARRARMEARPTPTRDAEASWSADGRASAPPRAPRNTARAPTSPARPAARSPAAMSQRPRTRLTAFAVAAGCRGDRGDPHRRGRNPRRSRPSLAARRGVRARRASGRRPATTPAVAPTARPRISAAPRDADRATLRRLLAELGHRPALAVMPPPRCGA